MISKKLLLELKTILEEDLGLKLTLQEATEIGTTLLEYVETLLKIEATKLCKGGESHV
jgi:hypothetical protein